MLMTNPKATCSKANPTKPMEFIPRIITSTFIGGEINNKIKIKITFDTLKWN